MCIRDSQETLRCDRWRPQTKSSQCRPIERKVKLQCLRIQKDCKWAMINKTYIHLCTKTSGFDDWYLLFTFFDDIPVSYTHLDVYKRQFLSWQNRLKLQSLLRNNLLVFSIRKEAIHFCVLASFLLNKNSRNFASFSAESWSAYLLIEDFIK